MSPREKHIPANASRTTVCLTAEERAAVRWISEVRLAKNDRRRTINDILVDSLWYLAEKVYGKTKEEFSQMVPQTILEDQPPNKVTEMPKPKRK